MKRSTLLVLLFAVSAEAHAQPVLEPPRDRGAPDGPARSAATAPTDHAVTASIAGGLERALLVYVRHPTSGRFARHCAEAPGGCEARVRRIVRSVLWETRGGDVDPWLVVAIMTRESGLRSDAVGAAGELGLMQLHPQGRAARAALLACHLERARSCGSYLIREGVRLLAGAIRSCGAVAQGLSRYNTGRCVSRSGAGELYARRVLDRRDELLRSAGGPT